MAKISITVEQITEIVQKLNEASNEIENEWNAIREKDIAQIKASWIGRDCDAYISKIEEMDVDVRNALQAQRLLAKTFEKAKTDILSAQDEIVSKINGV